MNIQRDPFDDRIPLERTADDCLFHWNLVVKAATNDWAKGFAKSIAKQSRRRGWKPSPKQLALMRQMVSALFQDHDDLPVIERD